MRSLTFHAPGLLRWESVPEPVLADPHGALVRPIAVAACDLDAALMESRVPLAGPFPLGHEFVAEVLEVGGEVTTVAVGQRVVVPFQISCGACARCRAGLTGNCQAVPPLSSYGLGAFGGLRWGGALTDLVIVPFADAMAVPITSSVEPEHLASLSDNIPDAYRTVADVSPGDDILIVGGGSIGLYATALAIGRGAKVTFVDPSQSRCHTAEQLGAAVENRRLSRPMARRRHVVHASADPDQLRNAMLSTDHDGTCVDTGIFFTSSVSLPLLDMYGTGMTLRTGRAHARRDIPAALEEIATGRFDPAKVTSAVVQWDDAVEAFASPGTKLVITRA